MKRPIYALVILVFCLMINQVHSYPSKPITILIGFGKGGTLYTQAEILAEILSEILDQDVFVESRPGLGGGMATAMVAASNDEGYFLLFTPSFTITDYPVTIQASYDFEDFVLIGAVSWDQHALVANSQSPYSDWEGFIEYAKQKGLIRYLSQNLTDREIFTYIARQEGFNTEVIPVSGGAGMTPLLLAGDADIAFSGGTHTRYTESGEMIVLAATGENRLLSNPEAPTLNELGYPLKLQSMRVLVAPKNTPIDQQEVLEQALKKSTQDKRFIQVTQKLIKQPVSFLNAEDTLSFLKTQRSWINQIESNKNNQVLN